MIMPQLSKHGQAEVFEPLRVGGELKCLTPPWLQAVFAPHVGDFDVGQVEFPSEQPRRPVCHPEPFR